MSIGGIIVGGGRNQTTYLDGIAKITDPFWNIKCDCGHIFLSCICNGPCPRCGNIGGKRTLDGRTLEEVIAERGEPTPFKPV